MASAKKAFLVGVPVVVAGGAGVWILINKFWKEPKGDARVTLSLGKFKKSKGANALKPKPSTVKPKEIVLQNTEKTTPTAPAIKNTEGPNIDNGDPKSLDQEPQQNIKGPEEELPEDRKEADDRVQTNDAEDKAINQDDLTPDPKEPIIKAGLDCKDVTEKIDCNVGGDNEINVEWNGKKGTYVPHGTDNGTFKLRISDDPISGNKYSFTITKKPIKLQNKSNPDEIITLEKYEKYGLEKDEDTDKVYLTRKLTADQGRIRSLGLPDTCTLPKDVSTESLKDPTCKLSTDQIGSVNFEGKKTGGATTAKNVNLYIQKVEDTKTYKGGYKFTFRPEADLEIKTGDKIKANVQKDFMLKNPNADDLVLEKVWKSENQLLSKFGLTCDAKGKCTITDGSLKIKEGNTYIEDGRKRGEGNIYLEWREAPYYEGLMFSPWGEGGITIESKANPKTTIKMEELGNYYIVKDDKGGSSSYYLTRKEGGVDDMLKIYLGVWSCPPRDKHTRTCQGKESDMSLYKFHDGEGKKHIKINKGDPGITIVITSYQRNYPFGYKFSIKPEKEIKIGKITLSAGVENNFRIKKDIENRKLYLEKASK